MVVVTLALSALQMKRDCTFSCSEWPQSARSLRVAWPASPATTHRQKHLWHGGYPRKRSSGLGWAGSCPSFDHSQTKLYKNKRLWLHSFLPFILNFSVEISHAPRSYYPVSLAQDGSYEFPALHYWSLLPFLSLYIACMWAVTWQLSRWQCKIWSK